MPASSSARPPLPSPPPSITDTNLLPASPSPPPPSPSPCVTPQVSFLPKFSIRIETRFENNNGSNDNVSAAERGRRGGGTAYTRVEEGAATETTFSEIQNSSGPSMRQNVQQTVGRFVTGSQTTAALFVFSSPSSLSGFTTCARLLQRNQVKRQDSACRRGGGEDASRGETRRGLFQQPVETLVRREKPERERTCRSTRRSTRTTR